MRWVLVLGLLICLLPAVAQVQKEQDRRMGWWREARFGLFIHWGLYSIPAGKWKDKAGYGEWIRDSAQIPVQEYEEFQAQFNPTHFDADKWVAMAKDAGMKYIVITTKHHDGFNLFRSKYTDWDVAHTPFPRDVMRELSEATRRAGLQMGWYHSIMDWHHPDYLPRRNWELKDRPEGSANFADYEKYLHNEVSQLLTEYGPIGVMWFDGQWEGTWNAKHGKALFDLCRKLQPNVIVNDRVSSGLPHLGDYTTPEQFIPDTGIPGQDWETCMTMNDHWGYNATDANWKSSKELIRNLVDIASKGGNYLLNIGPTAEGDFPAEAIERLHDIGAWMKVNSESIYGTEASAFEGLGWGRSTTKRAGGNTKLYLQVFDWPSDGKLVVPKIGNSPLGAKILGGPECPVSRDGMDLVVSIPSRAPSEICSVVELTVAGEPHIYRAPTIAVDTPILVTTAKVSIRPGNAVLETRYTTDGTDPTPESNVYKRPFSLAKTAEIRAASFESGRRVSAVASAKVERVGAWPAKAFAATGTGWKVATYRWEGDLLLDDVPLGAASLSTSAHFEVPRKGEARAEFVGQDYNGWVKVTSDGVYEFALTSDDGSRLWIDGKLVVDNDGLHGAVVKSGFAPLAKGWHQIRVGWFNKSGDAVLKVDWGLAGKRPRALEGVFH